MNIQKHPKSTLTTLIITLFICVISMANSHASTDVETITKILNHKIYQEKMGVGVSIAIISNNKTEFINTGLTNIKNNLKTDSDSLFEIGSISKTFTTTALASMVNEGKIKLTDPVQNYLPPQVKLPIKNGKPITFLSLANHSSGLPRLPTNMPMTDQLNPYADYTVTMMYQFLNNYQLPREVGAKREYSNLGVGLLGHVLALIDNKSYGAMLNDRVLEPLKMNHTYVDVPNSQLIKLSDGHNERLLPTKHWQFPTLAGAGAIKSSISDMAIYLRANMIKKPLNKALTLVQTTTANFGSPTTKIGLAWIIDNSNNSQLFMHDGGTGGFRSFMAFNQKKNKKASLYSPIRF